MNHLVITRCKFNDDQKFDNYFQMMKKYYFKSVNSQKNKNFTIVLICNPKHYDLIRNEVDKQKIGRAHV